MISFVYFDVGDTLLHKPEVIPQIANVLRRHHEERSVTEIRKIQFELREQMTAPPATNFDFYKRFNAELLVRLNVPAKDEIILHIYEACRKLPWVPYDDVKTLNRLQCQIGILSNWDTSLRSKLTNLVPVKFDQIIISGEIGVSKPDPQIFREALRSANRSASEVAIVGDSLRLDINPTTNLGWTAILYDPHGLSPHHTGWRIKSLSELATLFPSGATN